MQLEQLDGKGFFQNAGVSGAGRVQPVSIREATDTQTVGIVRGSAIQTKAVTYEKPESEAGKAVLEEIAQEASSKDAVLQRNELLFGVNQMTEDTAQGIEDDGFFLPDTDLSTIVTETDKIQAKLAKAGVDTSYFTDTPTMEQLEAMAGSQALAAQYAQAFAQSQDLRPLEEGTVKYMLENELAPTISNLYTAQYNGAKELVLQADDSLEDPSLLAQLSQVALAAGLSSDKETIDAGKWMAANDIPVTSAHMSAWADLTQLQLPPAEETVVSAMTQAVAEGSEPADACLAENRSYQAQAMEALDVISQVTDSDLSYVLEQGQELTIENLRSAHRLHEAGVIGETAAKVDESDPASDVFAAADGNSRMGFRLIEARRILEETRLVMTTEANYSLLKRGIQIDTRPLAQLVEQLRDQETSYYRNLLEADGSSASADQLQLFQQTIETADALKGMPAYALGSAEFTGTTESLYEGGAVLQRKLEAAGEAYETLMTVPRSDLGDSIQTAFRNVDAILQDMGMEQTDANARAVRILAYNQMEINTDSVTQMKLADLQVQQAFDSLKPAVVREMIKDGINPLQMDLNELNEQAKNIRSQIGGADDLTKYSEYLWKLEHNDSISQEERDSYIGIYRLIHQVEIGDGAAVGALVQQGAPLTMENLLRAVRSSKKSGMDYTVDDSFGGVGEKNNGTSISQQILSAYQTQCLERVQELAQEPQQFGELLSDENWQQLTPEELFERLQQSGSQTDETKEPSRSLELLRQAAACSTQAYEMLDAYDVPVTANHVLAMQQLLSSPNNALRRFFGLSEQIDSLADSDTKTQLLEEIAAAKEEILQKIGDGASAAEELAKAQETLAEVAEHCGQTMLREGMSRLDVRQFQMMHAQLQLGAQLAREERYQIPIVTDEGVLGVNVRIVRSDEKKGRVRITMDSEAYGKVAAELQAGENRIKGYFASDSREGADRLGRDLSGLSELFGAEGQQVDMAGFPVIYSGHLDLVSFELAQTGETPEQTDDTQKLRTSELYGIAEKVILFLQNSLTKGA